MNVTSLVTAVLLALGLSTQTACSKKQDAPAASKSGLAWEPVNYGSMSAACKKSLACCEEIAKQDGAATADDYNLKCSGPAIWKDDECAADLKARATVAESRGKALPDSCK